MGHCVNNAKKVCDHVHAMLDTSNISWGIPTIFMGYRTKHTNKVVDNVGQRANEVDRGKDVENGISGTAFTWLNGWNKSKESYYQHESGWRPKRWPKLKNEKRTRLWTTFLFACAFVFVCVCVSYHCSRIRLDRGLPAIQQSISHSLHQIFSSPCEVNVNCRIVRFEFSHKVEYSIHCGYGAEPKRQICALNFKFYVWNAEQIW